MVKVIMGKRGSGKTKKVIDLVNEAVNVEKGNVVCVERGDNLRFNIKYSAKLVDLTEYPMEYGYESLFCYLVGLYTGNYDITHIFIDNLYKVTGRDDDSKAPAFLDKLAALSEQIGVNFTITVSAPIEEATEGLKKHF